MADLKAGARVMEAAFSSLCSNGVAGRRDAVPSDKLRSYLQSIPGMATEDIDQEVIYQWISYWDTERYDPDGRRLPYFKFPEDEVELPKYEKSDFEALAQGLCTRYTDLVFSLRIGRWTSILGDQCLTLDLFEGCSLKLTADATVAERTLYKAELQIRYRSFVFPGCLAGITAGTDLARECCALLWASSELDYFKNSHNPQRTDSVECEFASAIDGGIKIPDGPRALARFDN